MTQELFEQEVTQLTQTMYRVSCAYVRRAQDRQDAVQSAILQAWQHKDRLRDESKFKPYLLRILVNECHTILRKTRHEVCIPLSEETASSPTLPDDSLREAVDALPQKLRAVVVLHYMEGASEEEMAAILRIPRGTVKSRLNRARTLLRDALQKEAGV